MEDKEYPQLTQGTEITLNKSLDGKLRTNKDARKEFGEPVGYDKKGRPVYPKQPKKFNEKR